MNLHGEIMNIPSKPFRLVFNGPGELNAYLYGHRDARHAAAELALKYDAIAASLRRLTAAVRQAGDISSWPVCGVGDVVGDELAAALVGAEKLIGG